MAKKKSNAGRPALIDKIRVVLLVSGQANEKQGIMENLRLSLKKKWFEMTKSGEKTEDYREITPYWEKRLIDFSEKNGNVVFKKFTNNTMTLGYPSNNDKDRIVQFEHAGIEIRTGSPNWGAEEGKLYFVIKHGKKL